MVEASQAGDGIVFRNVDYACDIAGACLQAEVKRMWIAPAARGQGLARRMMATAEDAARGLGIKTLRLDTNRKLFEAVKMYENTGWREIARFNDDPYPDIFFEKAL